jgi:pimeloyl-ACP methyl ester carboxylesterase/DNA-binding winged helix-turn-helix (wHTH) protein
MDAVRFLFDDFEIDDDKFELSASGVAVKVEPQVLDVLLHLIRHRDRVVTKEELLDEVWGDRFVSEAAITSRIKDARRAIGDDGQRQRCIRTHHGRGYRFVLEVEVGASGTPTGGATSASLPPSTLGAAIGFDAATDSAEPVRYTRSDDLNIAYQVTGSGPIDVLLVAGFVSHLTLDWTEPRHAHFLSRLGSFSRLIRFDKRGTGMSDRPSGLPDLETRMDDVRAVLDAVRSERAVLFGYSEGGPMSILFAATHPDRVAGLVLYGSYARRVWAPDYPWGYRPEERARYAEQLEQEWAWEADLRHMCPNADDELARWFGERCRAATSPGAARALIEMNSLVDVRDVLGSVRAPTLVLHRRDDVDADVEEGRYLADHIPDAQFVELDGADHFVAVDPDQILDPIERFVAQVGPAKFALTALTTLLVVRTDDGVDLDSLRDRIRDVIGPLHGEVVSSRDVELVACFDGPARAARAALALLESADGAGVGVAAGLHTVEVARRGREIWGAGVHVTNDVAARAPLGEAWATSTVRDLVGGSGLAFDAAGSIDHDGRRLGLYVVRPGNR